MPDRARATRQAPVLHWALWAWPAAFGLLALRHPDLLLEAQPTWEDGRIFLTQGMAGPWYATWFRPFLGYFILLPRMVASFFSPLTLLYAPLTLNIVSLAVMSFALTLPLCSAFGHLAPWRSRLAWVAAALLLPWATETFGNITNVHWYVFYALALFSMGDFGEWTSWQRATLYPLLVVAVFTTPNAVVVAPVLLVRLWRSRHGRLPQFWLHLFAALLIGLMAALAWWVGGAPERPPSPPLLGVGAFLLKTLGYKVVLESILGGARANLLQSTAPYVVGAIAFALLSGTAGWIAFRRGEREVFGWLLTGSYFVMGPMVLAAFTRPQYVTHFVNDGNYWGADRYFVVPSLFFFLLIFLAKRVLSTSPVRRAFAVPLVLIFSMSALQNFRYGRIPDAGWRRQLRAYYETLLDQRGPHRDRSFPIVTFPGPPWVLEAPLFSPSDSERARLAVLVEDLSDRSATRSPKAGGT